MTSNSLTQSKVLSPSTKSSSFYHIDIPAAQSFVSNESFVKQNFTPVQNHQEESTPYLQYIAHEQSNGVSTGFNLQSKILSVLKKDDRTYNESVFVYKHLKPSAFFQKFRQDHPNLRLTDALINLSRILQYHVYSPGAIIHRKGDSSNKKIYLVFSGKIDLYETIEKKSGLEASRPPAPKLENKTKSAFSLLGNREDSKTPKASARSEKPVILNTRALVGQASYEVAQEIPTLNTMKSNTDIRSFKFEPIIDEEIINEKSGPGGNKAFRGGKKILKKMKTVAFALKHAQTTLDLDKPQGSFRRNEESVVQDSGRRHFTSIDNLDNVMMKLKNKEDSTSIVMDVEEEKEKKPVDLSVQKNLSLTGAKNKFRKNFLKASFKGIAEEDLPKSSSQREELVDSQTSIENYMTQQTEREVKIKKGSVYKGEIFGDESLEKVGYSGYEVFDQKRRWTAQVGGDKECVLLSFCKEDYEYLCTRYDPENTRVLDFLLDYVPDLDKTAKEENLRRLESQFSESTYNWHQQVTVQGQRGDKIYLLFDGLCEVLKEVRPGADLSTSGMTDLGRATSVQGLTRDYSYGNKIMSILICVVKSGVFLGEEILFNGTGEYEYTVKAGSTKVRLLEVDKEMFTKIMPEKVQKSLRNLYNQKTKHNQEILNSKLQLQADIKQQRSGISGTGPTGALFDNFDENKETRERSSQSKRKLGPNVVQSRVVKSLVTITSKIVETMTNSMNKQQIYGLNDVKKDSEMSLRRYLESEPIERRSNTNTKEVSSWNTVLTEGSQGKKRPRVLLRKKKGSILRSENSIARPGSEQEEKRLLGSKTPHMSSTIRALMSPKANSKKIETSRFDFGRDLSESLVVKEIEDERDREARLVLKLKKKMLDRERNVNSNNTSRPSTTATASYYVKSTVFASNNTPRNGRLDSEPNWSVWGTPNPKAGGSPSPISNFPPPRDSVSLCSPPIHSVKQPKFTKRFSFNRKELSQQKILMEKTVRTNSLNVIQKHLKDEARDEYPVIEIFGKGL